ncbi:extracellular solute-binding protein [Martelella radicis]|uniref:Microcin C transport system substrate-binding protein n=1 Tax=Martelella radicis TaxID=1397476 RepID=A0A7W6KL17_9HYPH|nr:extracellular solute-binding protein [Martelella radicis]MBB4123107.1 microcin C transport system substrate-binding protein [Martelella radicis]
MWKTISAAAWVVAATAFALPSAVFSQESDEGGWQHASALTGTPQYPADFSRFDYVNPDAPKGGELKLYATGTFDSLNPVPYGGAKAAGLSLVFETLMTPAEDEINAQYGLLADGFRVPEDISSVTYRLNSKARFSDGEPVTAEDVVFSFDSLKELNARYANYYRHVVSAEVSGEGEVTFRFDETGNRELPQIVGQLLVLPKHWFADGRDVSASTLEKIVGSGPYEIAEVNPGSSISYSLREDYWGKDLPVNVGRNNFGSVNYLYFADLDVAFEGFRAGTFDFWVETRAKRWATGYNFPAVKDGEVKREAVPNPLRKTGIMQALVPNNRRAPFDDRRVREALIYAFDFETINKNQLSNAYSRDNSFWFGTDLASSGLPQGEELQILESVRDLVPSEVFNTANKLPVGGTEEEARANLQKAFQLLKEAGFERRGSQMVNSQTGDPFSFEILLDNPSLQVVVLPYVENLRKLGIDATIRVVDTSQYQNRVNDFDYDMIWELWAQSLSPGNEQFNYWGSLSAVQPGSENYAGIADPGIDALIEKVVFADDRDTLVAATKALDRVLLAHDFIVPLYYSKDYRIAYWDTITHPGFPEYGLDFPAAWWSTEAE